MEIKKLSELAALTLTFKMVKNCQPEFKKVFSEELSVIVGKKDSIFAEAFRNNQLHPCNFEQYQLGFGGNRNFRRNTKCKCACNGMGSLCNCSCAALLWKIADFKLRKCFINNPGRPNIDGDMKVGDILENEITYVESERRFGSNFKPRY